MSIAICICVTAVADSDFPDWWGRGGGANLLISQNFSEKCMKMKEFGARGAEAPDPIPWITH